MEKEFYKGRLEKLHNLKIIIPEQDQRELIHSVIYEELVQGLINDASRKNYLEIIHNMISKGAKGIILGCTEIGLLVKQADVTVPVFDTMQIHADAAVEGAFDRFPFS
jgi:aspartate racemase